MSIPFKINFKLEISLFKRLTTRCYILKIHSQESIFFLIVTLVPTFRLVKTGQSGISSAREVRRDFESLLTLSD